MWTASVSPGPSRAATRLSDVGSGPTTSARPPGTSRPETSPASVTRRSYGASSASESQRRTSGSSTGTAPATKSGTPGGNAEAIHGAAAGIVVPARARPRSPASTWARAPSSGGQTSPAASVRSTSGGLTKRRDDLVGRRELDSVLAPEGGAGGGAPLVEPTRRVLHEPHPPPALQEAADRRVVADDDLVGVERVQQRVRVGVREDVEVLLQQEHLASALHQAGHQARRERK